MSPTNQDHCRFDMPPSFLPRNTDAKELELPIPQLKFDFRIWVDLNPRIDLGQGPWGQRNWISFKGGKWFATWGKGIVLAASGLGDAQFEG